MFANPCSRGIPWIGESLLAGRSGGAKRLSNEWKRGGCVYKRRCMHRDSRVYKLAAQAHELGLPCAICELHFVIFALCIYPCHVCKYNVISIAHQ